MTFWFEDNFYILIHNKHKRDIVYFLEKPIKYFKNDIKTEIKKFPIYYVMITGVTAI